MFSKRAFPLVSAAVPLGERDEQITRQPSPRIVGETALRHVTPRYPHSTTQGLL